LLGHRKAVSNQPVAARTTIDALRFGAALSIVLCFKGGWLTAVC
jgi:hypothetical protein